MFRKTMLTVLAGTLFHGERKGQQASNQVDPTVLILDCCGFLFGIIPGVVALVIDYSNNTIYYTKAEVRANQHSSVKDIDRSGMIALKMDDMSNEAIEKALSRELGRTVSLADLQVVAAQ